MDPMAAEGLTTKQYRRFKAVVERLEEVGFYNIERDIKLENLEEIDEETWIPLRTCIAGAYFDRVFPRHTGQHEDRLAHADGEYRQIPRILDSMKIPGMVIPTYLELKQSPEPLCDRSRRARAEDERRKAQGAAGGKSHTKAEDLASCRFGNCCRRRGAKTLTKNATRSLRMKGFLNSSVHNVQQRGQITIEHTTSTAPTHALEEDADAEAVVQREAADEDTAADTPGTSGATSRSKHSWEISGANYTRLSIALNSLEGLRARIDLKQVITCTTISRNLLSLVRSRPTVGTSRSARLELYDNRGNTYPIKIVDNFFASRWHRHSTST
ncbi:hypothetical protein RI054_44g153390 [Pseudoscourfieldia marina]